MFDNSGGIWLQSGPGPEAEPICIGNRAKDVGTTAKATAPTPNSRCMVIPIVLIVSNRLVQGEPSNSSAFGCAPGARLVVPYC